MVYQKAMAMEKNRMLEVRHGFKYLRFVTYYWGSRHIIEVRDILLRFVQIWLKFATYSYYWISSHIIKFWYILLMFARYYWCSSHFIDVRYILLRFVRYYWGSLFWLMLFLIQYLRFVTYYWCLLHIIDVRYFY